MDREMIERFKRRQNIKQKIGSKVELREVDMFLMNKHLQTDANEQRVKKMKGILSDVYDLQVDVSVTEKEVKELLDILANEFDEQRFDNLWVACKREILRSITSTFGLGHIVARYDKDGGNVDTIHNVREGVYVTEIERNRYKNREKYDSTNYHSDGRYIGRNKGDSQKQCRGQLQDGYTRKILGVRTPRDLDHIISAKEIHDDPGRILAEVGGVELANVKTNLTSTHRTINRSKKDKSVREFLEDWRGKREQRREEINRLRSKDVLTDQEKVKLEKLEVLEAIDVEKALSIDQEARSDYNKTLSVTYYTSGKFVKNATITSTKEGVKMGMQQAVGLLMVEFFAAVLDELRDIYKRGYESFSQILGELKYRLKRISQRLSSKWENILDIFRDGFISAFLSNLVTTIINMFVRTGRRMVRMIREGFFSLLKAIRLLCFPPEDMTFAQAAHEAFKLIGGGLVIIAGIGIEEYASKMIEAIPILASIADVITITVVGALTGIATTLVVYVIDKIDFFKVVSRERDEYIVGELELRLEKMFEECDELAEELAW